LAVVFQAESCKIRPAPPVFEDSLLYSFEYQKETSLTVNRRGRAKAGITGRAALCGADNRDQYVEKPVLWLVIQRRSVL
jgi:hypothetical protein